MTFPPNASESARPSRDMMTVQATLQKQYAANVRITAKSVSDVQVTILNVTLVNE